MSRHSNVQVESLVVVTSISKQAILRTYENESVLAISSSPLQKAYVPSYDVANIAKKVAYVMFAEASDLHNITVNPIDTVLVVSNASCNNAEKFLRDDRKVAKRTTSCPLGRVRSVIFGAWSLEWVQSQSHEDVGVLFSTDKIGKNKSTSKNAS